MTTLIHLKYSLAMFWEMLWRYSGRGCFNMHFLELSVVQVVTAWLKLFTFIYLFGEIRREISTDFFQAAEVLTFFVFQIPHGFSEFSCSSWQP